MAPTQQKNSESTCLNNSTSTSAMNMASSKSQSTSLSASSSTNSVNSKININNNQNLKNHLSEMESLLPITCKGLFHDDSFFEESRKNFHQAVKEVLDQWQVKTSQLEDDFTSYRKLRKIDLREDNQAVSISQDDASHKVVLDVRDFMNGDVKVKMIDENELVVEGHVEKQDNGCISKKNFRRSFIFPGLVKGEALSSAMSSDGVLKVTIPKNNQSKAIKNVTQENTFSKAAMRNKEDILLPVTQKGPFFHDSFFESARKDFEKAVEDIVGKREHSAFTIDRITKYRALRKNNLKEENQAVSVTEDNDHHKVVLDVKDFMNGDLKVKMVDENELKIEGSAEVKKDGTTSTKSFCKTFSFPGLLNSDAVSSAMSSDGILNINVPKNKSTSKSVDINSYTSTHTEKKNESKVTTLNNEKQATEKVTVENDSQNDHTNTFGLLLPVFNKGPFFHDDFFESARQDYENAVKEVLNKWGCETSLTDGMISYRNLREEKLSDENQAVSVTEDHLCHKVVMDVRDFMQHNLKVKVIDENELVVEGTMEKREGNSVSKKSFHRTFVFPGLVKTDAVSSAMSSDGVLTITVPKKSSSEQATKTISISTDNGQISTSRASANSNLQSTSKSSNQSSQKRESEEFHNVENEVGSFLLEDDFEKLEKECLLADTRDQSTVHDDFFKNARQEFENSVKESNEWVKLNSSNFDKHENGTIQEYFIEPDQASSMTEDQEGYKIVIHVGDFVQSGIQVKLIDQNEVLVEGHKEKEEAGNSSSKNFSRRIQLPKNVKVDGISSTLSKDGILTITAMKDLKMSKMNSLSQNQNSVVFENGKNGVSNSHQEHSQQFQKTSGFACHSKSQYFKSSSEFTN